MNTLENVKQWFIDRDLENGVEDLKKAEFYLKRLIEELEHG